MDIDDIETVARLIARIGALEAELIKARHEATHDPLTGLLNRAGLSNAWAGRGHLERQFLALIDVDAFKDVNDRYGHATGDAVLIAVARALRGLPMAARLGGDEFVALVPTVGWLPARVGVTAPGGLMVSVALSIGLAPAVGDLLDVLTRADAAMYRAKGAETHVEVYDPYRDDRLVEMRPQVRLRERPRNDPARDVLWGVA